MSNLKFSLFSNKRDTMPQVREASWHKLCESFKRPSVRVNKDGWLLSPAKFDPPQRKKKTSANCQCSVWMLTTTRNLKH